MGQGGEEDYYAVVAWTSEIKIHRIVYEHGVLKGLEKVMDLAHHKKEALSVSFD